MTVNKTLLQDALGWGFLLWFVGYVLGIIAFMAVPVSLIGWFITPVATVLTLWVLLKKTKGESPGYYVIVGIAWTIIAVTFDYLLIVKAFSPPDGYYKLDVYIYYALTLLLPIVVGFLKQRRTDAKG